MSGPPCARRTRVRAGGSRRTPACSGTAGRRRGCGPEDQGPQVDEHDLDVERDEQQRVDIERDAEPRVGIAVRVDARLVRQALVPVTLRAVREQPRRAIVRKTNVTPAKANPTTYQSWSTRSSVSGKGPAGWARSRPMRSVPMGTRARLAGAPRQPHPSIPALVEPAIASVARAWSPGPGHVPPRSVERGPARVRGEPRAASRREERAATPLAAVHAGRDPDARLPEAGRGPERAERAYLDHVPTPGGRAPRGSTPQTASRPVAASTRVDALSGPARLDPRQRRELEAVGQAATEYEDVVAAELARVEQPGERRPQLQGPLQRGVGSAQRARDDVAGPGRRRAAPPASSRRWAAARPRPPRAARP